MCCRLINFDSSDGNGDFDNNDEPSVLPQLTPGPNSTSSSQPDTRRLALVQRVVWKLDGPGNQLALSVCCQLEDSNSNTNDFACVAVPCALYSTSTLPWSACLDPRAPSSSCT